MTVDDIAVIGLSLKMPQDCVDESSFWDILHVTMPTIGGGQSSDKVGAGTGGWTGQILGAFKDIEGSSGRTCFLGYTYTDITPAFFERARQRFSEFRDRISFKPFDLDHGAVEQGFQPGTYDLVIAGSVLHVTTNLTVTLRNIREVLKRGGRMIYLEPIAPDRAITNFGFEEWRRMSPAVDESQWDQLLRKSCFSGNDIVLRDYENPDYHLFSIMVSTAEGPQSAPIRSSRLLFVIDGESKSQIGLVVALQSELSKSIRYEIKMRCSSELRYDDLADVDMTISLLELDRPLLATMQGPAFQALKLLIKHSENLIWITFTSKSDSRYAFYNVAEGFLRSMRSEASEKHIVSLAIEANGEDPEFYVNYIDKIIHAAFVDKCAEIEYIVRDGRILCGRLTEEISLNNSVRSLTSPVMRSETWSQGPPVKLSVESPDDTGGNDVALGPGVIEIQTKAWGLSFRDVFVALGRLDGGDLGIDCAGVVIRVGPECKSTLRPGDRVTACAPGSPGCMRSYCRTNEAAVTKILGGLSFEEAASIHSPSITAYHSLVRVARLQKGDKILIHSASGSTGQMAIWIAKMVGAQVFATVGLDKKKQFLVDQFSIPTEHIFYSRNTTFAKGIMRVTNGYRVDECLAPYGRFIELGKADIVADSLLPMAGFAKNISFSAVDLHAIIESNQTLLRELLDNVMSLVDRGVIRRPEPLNIYPVSDTEQAFRHLQSGTSIGRTIITLHDSDVVPNASYLAVGGLGGLGRAMIKWMVEKGAKHLILLSRSELVTRGVHVIAPKCDVSSTETMPPIKGCINAAMVLQDAVFDNMTLEQWEGTIRSKIQTSWNLDQLLPSSLDFFILLSSLSGVYGSPAQSNYAAGCTFQDALARHRIMRGQKAVSLNLGWMRTIGIIAETEKCQINRKNRADMGQIEDNELMSLLDIYCDPSLPLLPVAKSQVLVGAVTPADLVSRGQALPTTVQRPLFAGFQQPSSGALHQTGDLESSSPGALFRQAEGTEEKCQVFIKALAAKLARALDISPDEVEPNKLLSDYGVDSLMAVELREWIGKHFHATVAVFDIMGGTAIQAIGELVTERSEHVKQAQADEDPSNAEV
ncbi:KR-domain-containing protein [Hypoxylon sp. FL0890]|nr:KR-domain-containing protein [Hypoxylon sp. FL0890]